MKNEKDLYLQIDGSSTGRSQIQSSETRKFIESYLPVGDRIDIQPELLKRFPLEHLQKAKAKQKNFGNRKNNLTYKETTKLNLRKLPKDGNKYSDFLQLNKLWCSYIQNYISLVEIRKGGGITEQGTLMLQKADFHGALLKVVRSKCPSLVGVEGIILMDTKSTFQIICKDDRVRIIAKQPCLFEILVEDITISVFGKHFVCKPAERTTKKVKTRLIKDLI